MAITIDTLAAVQDLEKAGIKSEHAKAIVKTVSQADADLVTKADLKAELATLEGRLTSAGYRLALAVIATNAAIVFGLLKLLLPD